ncbi:hypothetical protein MTR67_015706, partial [Solanum verrucosum]
MSAMLKGQLVKVFSLMKPGMLFQYEPELDAFLEFLIWCFSIWVDKAYTGNALMNLRYRDERAVEVRGKGLGNWDVERIVVEKLIKCLSIHDTNHSFAFRHMLVRKGLEGPGLTVAQKIWRAAHITVLGPAADKSMCPVHIALRLIGFKNITCCVFWDLLVTLHVSMTCRYRNLIERALRARLIYGSPNTNRAMSFEYMNRQLVWHEFSELLLLLLPLLNSSSIKNFLRPFSKDKSSDSSVDDTLCPICQGKPTIPFLAIPCQHSYCYYCLQTRCSSAPSFCFPRCGDRLLLCNDMVVRSTTLVRYNNSLE